MKKIIVISIYSLLLFCSCEYVREQQLDLPAPRAVLNGVIRTDSLFTVNLSRTYQGVADIYYDKYEIDPAPVPDSVFINDAMISFFLNGHFEGYLEPGSKNGNYYMPDYIVKKGDKIKLEVETELYEPLRTETTVPEKAVISRIDTTYYKGWEWNGLYANLTLGGLKSDGQSKKFYVLGVASWKQVKPSDEEKLFSQSVGFTFPEELDQHPDTYYMGGYMHRINFSSHTWDNPDYYCIFSSESFKEDEQTLQLDIPGISYSYYTDEAVSTVYLKFYLLSISPSFYLYLRSKLLQYQKEDIINGSNIERPIPSFTNVKGGYGLFSAIAENSREFTLFPMKWEGEEEL